jgi:hypothetical protein
MSDEKTKQNLPALVSEDALGKTPAFGHRKLSPLREAMEKADEDGPVRVIKKDFASLQHPDEQGPVAPDYQPENTQRIALSGETMRVSLERAQRASELPSSDDIPISWGGSQTPAPNPNRLLGNPDSLPQVLRWLLVVFFLLSMVGASVAVVQLLQ